MTRLRPSSFCQLVLLAGLSASPALALTPSFPAPATETAREAEPGTSYRLPIGPWSTAGVPTQLAEGDLEQVAWRIEGPVNTLDLAASLRQQLEAAGWTVLYACETMACGGFDFRYALPLLPEPEMHVDLGDFRFIAAEMGPQVLSLMISRADQAGFVQLTRITPAGTAPALPVPAPPAPAPAIAPTPAPAAGLAANLAPALEGAGSLVLADLAFATGASDLENPDAPSLDSLAAYLAAHPARRIALVGHTDASGTLAANIAISRARAAAVRQALIARGIAADRIEAEGVGYLAPRGPNLTPEGRQQNRRVEVMLTSDE